MSTVAKGTAFENRVFAAIQAELAADRLGLSPALARAHQRQAYYSRDRDADIITDLSIEVWLPSADSWSILWVCECKDYSGSVPVDDVEEFKAKLDQIAGSNKKGVLAISGALQSSALRYAKANGIGVIRLLPDNQVEHVLYMMTAATLAAMSRLDSAEFNAALTRPSFVGRNRDFYAAAEGYIFGDWRALLRHSLRLPQPSS
ncbi:restriction endonuclease [Novilysobacter erysipheiresistens]|uniref:Restriction endonuclease n=1 Tax=Novilysobacter erysipheiresistens TaxID=1749332 RepID=A0ABU7YXM7_9GAMM